jgi:hypothetical protein
LTSIHGGETSIDASGFQFILTKNKNTVDDIIEETTYTMETTLKEFTF